MSATDATRYKASGPFSEAGHDLCSRGLAVVPVGGAYGKVPLVTWARWQRRPGRAFLDKLIAKHPNANIGVLCGLSRLTIVDIDDPALVEPITLRCGRTPLATTTPSGGSHLWYRSNGERCANLRGERLEVDIKGIGGFVAVPPSTGYAFHSGSWSDLPALPTVRPDSLSRAPGYENRPVSLGAVGVGRRNIMLFRLLLRHAGACDTEDDLLGVAETIASDRFEVDPRHPFTPAEIRKTVASVWRYEQANCNWIGKEARAVTTASELNVLQRNPDALTLYLKLQCSHGARREPFAVSAKALAAGEFVPGWRDPRRYAAARDWLVEHGFLEQTHVGGRRARDPHLYRLTAQHRPTPAQPANGCSASVIRPGQGCTGYIGCKWCTLRLQLKGCVGD
jgi:hypothetical protein